MDNLFEFTYGLVAFLAVSESKLDSSFPKGQFNLPEFRTPYWKDLSGKSRWLLVYVNPVCPGVFLSHHAPHSVPNPCVNPDMKMLLTWNLAQSYFVMLQKNGGKFFQNCSYREVDVTNCVNFFEKLCEKWLKYVFSKINLVTARKKIISIFFQLLKVTRTYSLNIYKLTC